jgi:hypothetical protein
MPRREILASFWRDWDRLTPQQQRAFRRAVAQFIANLSSGGQGFHPRLRVKRVQVHPGLWEMTWPTTAAPPSSTARRFTAHHLAPSWPRTRSSIGRRPTVSRCAWANQTGPSISGTHSAECPKRCISAPVRAYSHPMCETSRITNSLQITSSKAAASPRPL